MRPPEQVAIKIMEDCATHGFVRAQCAEDDAHPCLVVWSDNAVEHIAAIIEDYAEAEPPGSTTT